MRKAEKRTPIPDSERMPTREELRAFASRRWDLVADEKLAFVAGRYRVSGADANRKAAQSIAQRWTRLHPGSPSPNDRQQDLEHHVELKQKLDRVAHAFSRR
jgi:hypothetical protein